MSGPTSRYDEFADFYASLPETPDDAVLAALLDLAGPVGDLRVLDLACADGRTTRRLARAGAHVVGMDASARLIEQAWREERREPLGIRYVLGDARATDALPGELFDGVTCNFGLSDIDDLDGALATVVRALRHQGWFVFSILHPCFPGAPDVSPSWPPAGYHDEALWFAPAGRSQLRRRVGGNHRMVSTYVNSLHAAGLTVEAMAEPPPDSGWLDAVPEARGLPLFLVARCRRSGAENSF
jgi:SAM-dependent methyltransferase